MKRSNADMMVHVGQDGLAVLDPYVDMHGRTYGNWCQCYIARILHCHAVAGRPDKILEFGRLENRDVTRLLVLADPDFWQVLRIVQDLWTEQEAMDIGI